MLKCKLYFKELSNNANIIYDSLTYLNLGGGHSGSTTSPSGVSSVSTAVADSCMLALDYAQNKVRKFKVKLIQAGICLTVPFYRSKPYVKSMTVII